MGEPIQKTYGALNRRETLFFFDPFKLVVVGLDAPDGASILTDPDRLALGVDEAMVDSITAMGIIEPVVVRKNGSKKDGTPNTEVVAGRGRVTACRVAWQRMRTAGVPEEDLPPVPAIRQRGEDADFLAAMIAENLIRRQETPLSAARKAMRFFRVTKDKRRTAKVCGVSVQTLDSWLDIVELAPEVQKAIERGEVGAVAAVTLLKDVPVEQQAARFAVLAAEGKITRDVAKAEAKNAKAPKAGDGEPQERHVLPSKRYVRRFREGLQAHGKKHGGSTYTWEEVGRLLDFLLDGKPLPKSTELRDLWKAAIKPAPKAKTNASKA